MKHSLLLLTAVVFAPSVFAVEKTQLKSLFCVPADAGEWEVQQYPPLIDPKKNTTFAELWTYGAAVERVKLRRFVKNRQVMFEYRYDPSGELKTIQGTVEMFGSWIAEGDLPVHGDPGQLPQQVRYYGTRRSGDAPRESIPPPANGSRYVDDFKGAPRFMTTRAVPCADKLSKVESVHATQK